MEAMEVHIKMDVYFNLNSSTTTMREYENATDVPTYCALQPQNPWCGQFGAQQIFEVIYLSTLSLAGLIGNLMLIFSIILDKKVHKHGNAFIINLAFADLLVTGVFTPTVITNVIETGNALPLLACQVFGYVIIMACSCSMWNLGLIALNRYLAIARDGNYCKKLFSKCRVLLMILFTWGGTAVLASPTLYGWTTLIYDYKSMICAWDDTASLSFSIFIVCCAVFVPFTATVFCYWKLFWNVREQSKNLRTIIAPTGSYNDGVIRRKSLQREISLLKTLATAVVVFVLFWAPYSFCVIINPKTVHPLVKKICTWLGLTNSAVNFIIYGVMNQGYRDGYKRLLARILCKRYKIKNRMSTIRRSNLNTNVA